MKKLFLIIAVLILCGSALSAQRAVKLDDAIGTIAKNLSDKLPAGTKVVIIDIRAETNTASEYIIEQLTVEFLNLGKLVVVDRKSLDLIRQELSFQMSGDVSDESAQRIGGMVGAETLISGSFEELRDSYRLSMKAVKIETSEIQYLSSTTIQSTEQTDVLTGKAAKPSAAGTVVRKAADFSGRLIAASINPLFGIGSFIQGDSSGGSTVVFWEGVGLASLLYAGSIAETEHDKSERWAVVGTVSLGIGVVYSWIRPWTYNRAPKVAQTLDNIRVNWTAADEISVGYRLQLK